MYTKFRQIVFVIYFLIISTLLQLSFQVRIVAQNQTSTQTTDLSIAQAVEMAINHSPYLKAMYSNSKAIETQIEQSKAMKKPKISFSLIESKMNSPLKVFGTKLEQQRVRMTDFNIDNLNHPNYETNLQISMQILQPIYLANMDKNAINTAKKAKDASLYEIEQVYQQVIYKTIEAYLQVVLARESLYVAQKAVEAAQETVKNASAAVDAMQAVESDLLQAKVHLSQNEESYLRYQNQYRLAKEALSTILGVESVENYNLNMPFIEQVCESCNEDPHVLHSKALDKRPDYLKIKNEIKSLEFKQKMVLGKTKPTVVIGAQFEHNKKDLHQDGNNSALYFARVDWNAIDGSETKWQSKELEARIEQMNKMLQATSEKIFLEIREAIYTINNALNRINVSKEAIKQSEESLRILRNRYNAGLAIMSDVLRAETSLLSHRMNLLNALYDYSISRAKLKLALGELTPKECVILQTNHQVVESIAEKK